ncbi:NTP transferase domain-containing protein [Microbacterium sp.]|uniref:NTP transferase domain-containing protein n=1 Tax=Microbacterium sp. TaxID=51671 RepID=UPI0035654CE8
MKTVILAGGRGSRLTAVPAGHKAATRFGSRSLLEHAFAEVQELGVAPLCIVNDTVRDLYEGPAAAASAQLITTNAENPCAAVKEVVHVGETVLIVHADEVCLNSHPALYGVASERFTSPVVGVSSAGFDNELQLIRRPVAQMRVAAGGRFPSGGSVAGTERRYIGRYALTVDDLFRAGLDRCDSVIEAAAHRRPDIIELNIPKAYFDCGTDEMMKNSRQRLRVLA